MSLLSRIKADQLQARKAKDTIQASLLTTLIGEAEAVGKNDGNRETTDSEVVAMIKKFLKNTNELLAVFPKPIPDHDLKQIAACNVASQEKLILEAYLPTQYTGTGLQSIVAASIQLVGASTAKDMGKVMKDLKTRYDGQYDGSEASKVIKELLQ
jgi:hypothetical protein